MKKKGFTLIELLAVIVILAIIALIATPLVLKYIETARTNSKITSTHNYMKAVENALASYSITNKGKSYPEGCYEISKLNNDLDISIKGDLPSEGTICIEDNKIEKGIVKYPDNKIIKYEDSKATLSDEEMFESFNSVSNYIIDEDLEFAYDESAGGYVATLPITSDIASQFSKQMDYDLIIDNGEAELIYAFTGVDILAFVSHDNVPIEIVLNNEMIVFAFAKEILGIHNVKIGNARLNKEKILFSISDGGSMTIIGNDLIAGDANIVIKDEEGTEYYNDTITLEDYREEGIIAADWGCRDNMPKHPEVYTALINGKTITIEVTQTVDGKEIVSSVTKGLNSMLRDDDHNDYLSRQSMLLIEASGC